MATLDLLMQRCGNSPIAPPPPWTIDSPVHPRIRDGSGRERVICETADREDKFLHRAPGVSAEYCRPCSGRPSHMLFALQRSRRSPVVVERRKGRVQCPPSSPSQQDGY